MPESSGDEPEEVDLPDTGSVGTPLDRLYAQIMKAQALEDVFKSRQPEGDPDNASVQEESTDAALEATGLRLQTLKLAQREQDMRLRRKLSDYAIWIVIVQLAVANLFFGFYLWHNPIDPQPPIMIAWLSSTVVEVVGILWVIARNLFPYRDKSYPKSAKDTRGAGAAL